MTKISSANWWHACSQSHPTCWNSIYSLTPSRLFRWQLVIFYKCLGCHGSWRAITNCFHSAIYIAYIAARNSSCVVEYKLISINIYDSCNKIDLFHLHELFMKYIMDICILILTKQIMIRLFKHLLYCPYWYGAEMWQQIILHNHWWPWPLSAAIKVPNIIIHFKKNLFHCGNQHLAVSMTGGIEEVQAFSDKI